MPSAGGHRVAMAPQLAADDVTHGGDGALAEQVCAHGGRCWWGCRVASTWWEWFVLLAVDGLGESRFVGYHARWLRVSWVVGEEVGLDV